MSTDADKIAAWIKQQVVASAADGLVVGLSGGIDSAVVARLCQIAMPNNILGVLLPCHSDPQDEADANLVAQHFKLPTITIELEKSYDALLKQLQGALASQTDGSRMPEANLKPRLRMTSLYFVANTFNYLVAGTGNRSELEIGYFTKYGDGGLDMLPLGNLFKDQVRTLARELDIPTPIIEKAPSAGLWLGQTDENEMGFSYADLELYLRENSNKLPGELTSRIEHLMRSSAHKRALPPRPPEVDE